VATAALVKARDQTVRKAEVEAREADLVVAQEAWPEFILLREGESELYPAGRAIV
jgi:hypothetical protein